MSRKLSAHRQTGCSNTWNTRIQRCSLTSSANRIFHRTELGPRFIASTAELPAGGLRTSWTLLKVGLRAAGQPDVGRRQTQERIVEEAGVGVDAGVENSDHLIAS